MRFGVYLIEQGIKKCAETGADKLVVIYDREGFDRKNFDSKLADVMKSLMKILQDYYAERLAVMYVLKPNWFYKLMVGMIRPFLDEKTRNKIKLVDKLDDLKKHFDDDQLMIEHGGTSPYRYAWPEGTSPLIDTPNDMNSAEQDQEDSYATDQAAMRGAELSFEGDIGADEGFASKVY